MKIQMGEGMLPLSQMQDRGAQVASQGCGDGNGPVHSGRGALGAREMQVAGREDSGDPAEEPLCRGGARSVAGSHSSCQSATCHCRLMKSLTLHAAN